MEENHAPQPRMPQPPPHRGGLANRSRRWQALPTDNRQQVLRVLTRLVAQQLLRSRTAGEVAHEQE
jgi:hypothetical protein